MLQKRYLENHHGVSKQTVGIKMVFWGRLLIKQTILEQSLGAEKLHLNIFADKSSENSAPGLLSAAASMIPVNLILSVTSLWHA